ncbi:unnamed protein product [Adineta steineri]|uniref:Ubiquitin-like domain-containing protein n=1 Tax=Adineta steineri TaxID=433720 RepID=A0A819E786_9BILA|nr:unnamed protein product [Adineta steineri]CAF3845390.1 unnamed protein product [Adineta steineri]
MSSNNMEYHHVKMVRMQSLSNNETTTHDKNVTINILHDQKRQCMYLCIKVDGENVYTSEFSRLGWLTESSTDGVAAIRAPKSTIIIIYAADNTPLKDFFAHLQVALNHTTVEPVISDSHQVTTSNAVSIQLNQDSKRVLIEKLIKSINRSDLNETEHITQKLANVQARVQFNLSDKNDKQRKKIIQPKLNDDIKISTDPILDLGLRIECQIQKDAIIAPIKVRSGTTLQSLKKQIEKETNIKYTNQYWFAFDRYPIPDEYIFGSAIPSNLNQTQQKSLMKPIRSGDTLTIYIT